MKRHSAARRAIGSTAFALALILGAQVAIAAPQVAYLQSGKLYLHRADGTDKTTVRAMTGNGLFWSPDGSKIANTTGRYNGAWIDSIKVYDLATKSYRTVASESDADLIFNGWSPNSLYIVYSRAGSGWRVDTTTGAKTSLGVGSRWTYSPNGRYLGFVRGSSLMVRDNWAGTTRTLANLTSWSGQSASSFMLQWRPDSTVLYARRTSRAYPTVYAYRFSDKLKYTTRFSFAWDASPNRTWSRWAQSDSGALYVRGVDGFGRLVANPWVNGPDISTDGRWVCFDRWASAGTYSDAYASSATGAPRKLASGGRWSAVRPSPNLWVGPVIAPANPVAGVNATYYGYMSPAHTPGGHTVKLVCYHFESSGWVLRRTIATTNVPVAGGKTKYTSKFSLAKGSWAVYAYHPLDSAHKATYSTYSMFTVE